MTQASSGVAERRSTVKPTAIIGLTDVVGFLAEKQATGRSGSLAYIRPHPGSFEATGVREKLQKLC
jgi:hypothetical protein